MTQIDLNRNIITFKIVCDLDMGKRLYLGREMFVAIYVF